MQTIKLNLIPGGVLPVVNVSQYDVGRQFAIQVYEGAASYSLTGKSVEIRGTKPDGNGFAYDSTDGAISVSGSTVTVTTLQQMTACGGDTTVELRITASGVVLGTLNFILAVETSALSDDTPISDTDIPAIERDFQAALDEAEADALVAEGWAKETQDGVPVASGSPYYHKSAYYNKQIAEASATTASTNALKSEGYAVGTQNGAAVTSGSPYYENNAKYYAERAAASVASGTQVDFYVSGGHLYVQQTIQGVVQPAVDLGQIGSASAIADLTDVDLTSLADGDYLRYNSTAQKWEVSHAVTDNLAAVQEAGAVNHLDVDAVSQVVRGITYTINANKSVTMNGTNTDANQSVLRLDTDFKDCSALAGKNAIFGGFNVGIPVAYGYAQCYFYDSSNTEVARITARWADAVVFVPSNAVKYRAAIFISPGATINNVTVYPMLYDARLVNPTYQPYTMTNRELTDRFLGGKGRIFTMTGTMPTALNTTTNTSIPNADTTNYKYQCLGLDYLHGSSPAPYQFPNPWCNGYAFVSGNQLRVQVTYDDGTSQYSGRAFTAIVAEIPK